MVTESGRLIVTVLSETAVVISLAVPAKVSVSESSLKPVSEPESPANANELAPARSTIPAAEAER